MLFSTVPSLLSTTYQHLSSQELSCAFSVHYNEIQMCCLIVSFSSEFYYCRYLLYAFLKLFCQIISTYHRCFFLSQSDYFVAIHKEPIENKGSIGENFSTSAPFLWAFLLYFCFTSSLCCVGFHWSLEYFSKKLCWLQF